MDLTSYAELAVRLVNTAAGVGGETDQLGTTGAFRAFVADYPHLRGPWTHHDLDALRMLRDRAHRGLRRRRRSAITPPPPSG